MEKLASHIKTESSKARKNSKINTLKAILVGNLHKQALVIISCTLMWPSVVKRRKQENFFKDNIKIEGTNEEPDQWFTQPDVSEGNPLYPI